MTCKKCGACCRYLLLPLSSIPTEDEKEWIQAHKDVIKIKNNVVVLSLPCKHLTRDNRCAIYEQRPDICKEGGKTQCQVARTIDRRLKRKKRIS